MREGKLLLFLMLVIVFNVNKCKYIAYGKNLQMHDKTFDAIGENYQSQGSKLLRNRFIEIERRKRGFSEKEKKQDGNQEWFHNQNIYNIGSRMNSNMYSSNNAFKRRSTTAHTKDSGSSHIDETEKQRSPKRVTLWSLEGLSDDFPRDLNRLAPDQGEKIGDEALPSLVRNIEPTDYRAYAQYRSLSETEADEGSELEKSRNDLLGSLFKRNGNDGRNHMKKSTTKGHKLKSVRRKKRLVATGDSNVLSPIKKDGEIKKLEEKKQENLGEPISNAAGTNESGLIEIEREQEFNEEAVKKEKNDSDAEKNPLKV